MIPGPEWESGWKEGGVIRRESLMEVGVRVVENGPVNLNIRITSRSKNRSWSDHELI